MEFVAFTSKGLEFIAEKEIKQKISDSKKVQAADKRIFFESNASFDELIGLRTVDDLGVVVAELAGIESLESLMFVIENIDFEETKSMLADYRKELTNEFSITLSFVGAKNINQRDLIYFISQKLEQKYNWKFNEFNHKNFDIRIFLDKDEGLVSVRLTKESLYQRAYRKNLKEGAIKPSVAAAMVYLASGGQSDLKIVDNFCGSGTILAESIYAGNEIFGGDVDSKSVLITKNNLSNLGFKREDNIKRLNALNTNWTDNFFNAAISNLPWDKQVKVESITDLYIGTLKEYSRIVKSDGVICLIITKPELLIRYAKNIFPFALIKEIKIGLLGQTPSIVLIKR
jgi:tRNA (guanine6-N2)-methyltransferase